MSSLAVLIPICCGILMAIQSPTNAALSRVVTGLGATALSFGIGTALQIIIVLIFGNGDLTLLTTVPWWQWLGGAYGGYIVLCMTLATPPLGVVLTGALMMFGQVSMGAAIDAFGWFQATQIPLSPLRIVGILAVCAGILVMYLDARSANVKHIAKSDSEENDEKKHKKRLIGFALLAISAGFASAFQSPTNATLAKTVGTLEATLVSFSVGFIIFLVAFLIKNRGKFISLKGIPAWQFFSGAYGIAGVCGNIIATPIIGVGLMMAGIMFGQIGGGMVVDTFGWFRSRKIRVSKGRVGALICIGVGIACIVIAKTML